MKPRRGCSRPERDTTDLWEVSAMPRHYTPRRPRVSVTCGTCSAVFLAKASRPDTKFCSRDCQIASTRFVRPILTCPACHQPFEPRVDRMAGRRYCSKSCYVAANEATTEQRACLHCGDPFTFQLKMEGFNKGIFCSTRCRDLAKRIPTELRLWPRVVKSGECWTWTGPPDPKGYGRIAHDQKSAFVHRVAWSLASGTMPPDDLGVCHTCDNPPCVRNDTPGWYEIRGVLVPRFGHLWIGTHLQNMHDMIDKGRRRPD